MSDHTTKPTSAKDSQRSVLDPAWEDCLRAGQAEDGEAGSVEAELAVVHLLRHARAAEPLTPQALDQLWSTQLLPQISPRPWWRRSWVWGLVPTLAAAAVLVVITLPKPQPLAEEDAAPAVAARSRPEGTAIAAATSTPTASPAQALARQFAQLEGDARRDLGIDVERGRGVLRTQLLASAHAAGDTP